MIGVLTPACTQSWAAYVTCASTQTFTCDTDGTAQPEGCTTERIAAFACILTGLGG